VAEQRLVVDDLVVEFVHDGYAIRPLDGLSFTASPGELVVLLGPSGSGKTTLLSCLGGILTPTSGSIRLGELDITALKGKQLDKYRCDDVGFVFQAFNLIPSLTAHENVAIPMMLAGSPRRVAMDRAAALLDEVGLGDRLRHRPAKLSGGQQQRVAVARGLVGDPHLLLADEPTANLDLIQAESIIRLLRELRAQGRAIVVSTHDARLLPIADRVVRMTPEAGEVVIETDFIDYEAGQVVFEQGDPSDVVYTIESGAVQIVRVLSDGSEEELATLTSGSYFGELGPLLGFPRSATARALTKARLRPRAIGEFREEVLDHGGA